jgi:cardiolipin synthase
MWSVRVKLIVQPRDGLASLISGIRLARKEIDLVIFRFDRPEIEKALDASIKRGVRVRALIAHTNRGGEKNLRKLEQKLLEVGATVARTGDEFVRYHGKFMVIDRTELWLLGFNFTALDTSGSRSFGIVTRQRAEVQEALRLFEADVARQPHAAGASQLVVSPENARAQLGEFISKARHQLLIYDPKISDASFIRLLKDRVKNGVDVRLIGKIGGAVVGLPQEKYPGKRMHVRAIVRDGRDAFVGSQSLRRLELEKRREVGIIVHHAAVVNEIRKTFEEDWALTDSGRQSIAVALSAASDQQAQAEA